ncbi:MAG: hypothetical protein Q8N08_04010 [Methanobacteriaceae archaeon]|nr:hypothetical protein [Methanobacteriaceae archaeon]
MAIVVELDFVKGFLGILDDTTTYDEDIELLIPLYLNEVTKDIDIDNLTAEEVIVMQSSIAGGIGCHLSKSKPAFSQGQNIKKYVVGKIQKEFGEAKAVDTWCTYYDLMKEKVNSEISEGSFGSFKRLGVADEYLNPY